jgi:hypothetical protein
MPLDLAKAKTAVTTIRHGIGTAPNVATALTAGLKTHGKVYEALVLAEVLRHLHVHEQLQPLLSVGTKLTLKSAPGPINRQYPYFSLVDAGGTILAEVWTDVEFATMSSHGAAQVFEGDHHELDILVTEPGLNGHPPHDSVWLGVECKHTVFAKSMLREVLGIRRELSLLQSPQATRFKTWPQAKVPASPNSSLLVCSTDSTIAKYQQVGDAYGLRFLHVPVA